MRLQYIQEYLKLMEVIDLDRDVFQLSLSKKMRKSNSLKSLHARIVDIKGKAMIQATYRHDTQDVTKNFDLASFIEVCSQLLSDELYHANMIHNGQEHILLTNKKRGQITSRPTKESASNTKSNDRSKHRLIAEDEPFLQALGLASSNGKIYKPSQKKYRQINKFVEIIAHTVADYDIEHIADMGCGKGYLSFAVFRYLSQKNDQLKLTGYELRPGLVSDNNEVVSQLGWKGLQFEVGNIATLQLPKTDMVIALHACDIATDMAIAQGINGDAKVIVVSPCCHKQIRKAMNTKGPLQHILKQGIMQERLAEWITDTIRVLLLEAHGYRTKIFEFISSEHTAKNLLITAVKTKPRKEALQEIEAIKAAYGIERHYLETLL